MCVSVLLRIIAYLVAAAAAIAIYFLFLISSHRNEDEEKSESVSPRCFFFFFYSFQSLMLPFPSFITVNSSSSSSRVQLDSTCLASHRPFIRSPGTDRPTDRPTIRLLQKLVPDEIDPPLPRRRQLIPRLNGRAAVAVAVLLSSLFLITQFSRRFNCRGRHRGDGKRATVAVLYKSRRLVVSF